MNPTIYLKYTECNNDIVLENISLLTSLIPKDKILFRIPHIPNYNTEKDIQYSISRLEHLGRLDVFEYEMEL
ncbi:MAG: radical SAM protein, partial [Holdemanella sp.]|nr:radical SAM protein [Holdemanella sp.]